MNENILGVVSWNSSRRSASSNASLPTMLIWRIFATTPSEMSKFTATRFRSSGVIVLVIWTPYLPSAKYVRLSSCST